MKKFLCVIVGVLVAFSGCGEERDFDGMGIFEGEEILLSSEISGRIIELNIKEGNSVEKGEILGRIDSKALELQAQKLLLQINNAKAEKTRLERLARANAGAQKNVDDATFALEILQKEYAILEDNIAKTRIIAPRAGVVLEKYAFVGELSVPNKPLLKLANIDTLELKAYLIHSDITRIKLGQKVKVFSDYEKGYKEYEGIISFISPKAEFTPKTIMTKNERENLVYAVKVTLKNDGLIKIGSYGQIKIVD